METKNTHSCGIISLTKVAVNATGAGGVDYPAVLLFQHIWISSLGAFVGSSQMYCNHVVPKLVIHVGEGLVSQDSSVVDQNIYSSVCVDGCFYDGIAIFSGGFVADRFSSHLLNLLHNGVRVDKIIDHRGTAGNYEYLVHWKNYPDSDRTWGPQSSFLDDSVIKEYWQSLKQDK